MKAIEINQLKYYQGTGLKYYNKGREDVIIDFNGLVRKMIVGIPSKVIDEYEFTQLSYCNAETFIPIMFPLSALTEPVLEGGKIPIVELARLNSVDDEIGIIDIRNVGCIYGLIYFDSMGDKFEFIYSSEIKNFTLRFFGQKTQTEPCYQLALFEQLFNWHFWLYDQSLFETGQLIDKRTVK